MNILNDFGTLALMCKILGLYPFSEIIFQNSDWFFQEMKLHSYPFSLKFTKLSLSLLVITRVLQFYSLEINATAKFQVFQDPYKPLRSSMGK